MLSPVSARKFPASPMDRARCQSHSQSLHPAVFAGGLKSGQLVLLCSCLAMGIISPALTQQQLLSRCVQTERAPPQAGLGLAVENGAFSASLASAVGWGGLAGHSEH